MDLFGLRTKYNTDTGKPYSTYSKIGWICDYCGEFHDFEYNDGLTLISYTINETDEVEPQFSQYRLDGFSPEINVYDVFNNHTKFTYCQDLSFEGYSCEFDMVKEWYKKTHADNPSGLFSDCFMFCQVMYAARMEMLSKVLKDKKYTIEQFQLSR